MDCPCGCGRRFGAFSVVKKGAAIKWTEIAFAVPTFQEATNRLITAAGDQISERDRAEVLRAFGRHREISGYLLDHMHGSAAPGRTPDLQALRAMTDGWIRWGIEIMLDTEMQPPPGWG